MRPFLSLRDSYYLLGLLIPFIVYVLALKATFLASIPGVDLGFYLMRSNVFFDLGYALLMIGLLAAAPRGGLAHCFVIILFHVMMVLLVVVATSSYQYFRMIGTALAIETGSNANNLSLLHEALQPRGCAYTDLIPILNRPHST